MLIFRTNKGLHLLTAGFWRPHLVVGPFVHDVFKFKWLLLQASEVKIAHLCIDLTTA